MWIKEMKNEKYGEPVVVTGNILTHIDDYIGRLKNSLLGVDYENVTKKFFDELLKVSFVTEDRIEAFIARNRVFKELSKEWRILFKEELSKEFQDTLQYLLCKIIINGSVKNNLNAFDEELTLYTGTYLNGTILLYPYSLKEGVHIYD